MNDRPRIFADFQNADTAGRIRLSCAGTERDLERLGIELAAGMKIRLYDDELEADAVVSWSGEESRFVATIDWGAFDDFRRGVQEVEKGQFQPLADVDRAIRKGHSISRDD